ncbi:DNA-binding response regulator [Saccharothrix saharensis]|uniref:DNA-binding response regulator n=1 Tax=Saccharothrix saharensis TaxID=571190 RepID=UPI0036866061
MVVRVAVVDPLPVFRHGVSAVLSDAGHTVETPADVLAWSRRDKASLVLLTVLSEDDWAVLGTLCGGAGSPVVIAVVEGGSPTAGARAVRLGARSVLPRGVAVDVLRQTVTATISGQAVMPAAVASALAAGTELAGPKSPSADQLSWLRHLANGATVAQVADRAGYSERAMFRLLRALYRQLGVRTRLEAIMLARESDWL